MIIDFSQIKEESVMNFKGGKGELCTRNYIDGKCKIMKSCLRPGASSGLHTHEGNCEIVYIISGTATFYYDGEKETANPGEVHYCPEGHAHYMENNTDTDLVYLAIVPEHR
ncbi:cupin domain-containing protein [Marseilla massiliensis]|jgi:quercetin dioxygenase-like cupin family protein|uniref:Cupin domain-containing protein n=1 Tax=Marseilla massiliensis TaxID=1841864 RepID=A0A938WU70_9BACT|nr:cupin domain-containing protein [Marseilla massiliensis]MBM6673320.1 cupin domain-containing protein [Marseilla massiliensis]